MTRTVKFKRPKPVRMPKAPDLREMRGDLRSINRQMRDARDKYMRACLEAGKDLRGKQFADYALKVSEAMITAGLYSNGPTVGFTAYCILGWFARFEAGNDYWARRRWWDTRGITDAVHKAMRWERPGDRRIILAREAS